MNNYENLLYKLVELTKVEYNNISENNATDQKILLEKAYRKTNSLNKIKKLAMKYELCIPHEENEPTIIPFLLVKKATVPDVNSHKQAVKYLEAYSLVMEDIEHHLSNKDVEYCFGIYTFDYFTEKFYA